MRKLSPTAPMLGPWQSLQGFGWTSQRVLQMSNNDEAKKLPYIIEDKSARNLILSDPNSNKDLREAARLSLCQAGEKLQFVYDGDKGYSVIIPDPKYERCSECLSYDHWEFREVESYSKWDANKFFFKCTNIYSDCLGEIECEGRLEVSDD